jgi:hypothetical protein
MPRSQRGFDLYLISGPKEIAHLRRRKLALDAPLNPASPILCSSNSTTGLADGVVTLSAISLISAIVQQAKWLKSHAEMFAVIG